MRAPWFAVGNVRVSRARLIDRTRDDTPKIGISRSAAAAPRMPQPAAEPLVDLDLDAGIDDDFILNAEAAASSSESEEEEDDDESD